VIRLDEDNLKQGLLGLVVALVEIIQESLEVQALRRIESGKLNDQEVNRLGQALMDLSVALWQVKEDNGLTDVVSDIRHSLDRLVDDVLDRMVNPERWVQDQKEFPSALKE